MNARISTLVTAVALLAGATTLTPLPAQAQRGGGAGGPGRMEMERRIRARFGEMVALRLQLTEEEQAAMGQILQEFQEQRESLALREAQLRRRVQGQGRLGPGATLPPLTDEEALVVLQEMSQLRTEEIQLAGREQERLLEILTPVQLVRFYAMRDQLAATVQRLQGGAPPGGGMRRGGGGGGVGGGAGPFF